MRRGILLGYFFILSIGIEIDGTADEWMPLGIIQWLTLVVLVMTLGFGIDYSVDSAIRRVRTANPRSWGWWLTYVAKIIFILPCLAVIFGIMMKVFFDSLSNNPNLAPYPIPQEDLSVIQGALFVAACLIWTGLFDTIGLARVAMRRYMERTARLTW